MFTTAAAPENVRAFTESAAGDKKRKKKRRREESPSAHSGLTFLLSFVLWSLFLLLGDGLRHVPAA